MLPINNGGSDDREPATTPITDLPSLDTPLPATCHIAQVLNEMDERIASRLQHPPDVHVLVDEAVDLMYLIWDADDLRHELVTDSPVMPEAHHNFLVDMLQAGHLELIGDDRSETDAEGTDDEH